MEGLIKPIPYGKTVSLSADLNSIVSRGLYNAIAKGVTNGPTLGKGNYVLEVIDEGGYIIQKAYDVTDSKIFFRVKGSAGWKEWITLE